MKFNLEEYPNLETKEGVCSGRPIIKGTRLEPSYIISYGTKEEVMRDFSITEESYNDCLNFVRSISLTDLYGISKNKGLTLKELKDIIDLTLEDFHGVSVEDIPVLITTHEKTIGARASSSIRYAGLGFDWEYGQFRLEPSKDLVPKGLSKVEERSMITSKYYKGYFCPECGNRVYKTDRYCRHCGQKLIKPLNT